jgi:hypothetical protein
MEENKKKERKKRNSKMPLGDHDLQVNNILRVPWHIPLPPQKKKKKRSCSTIIT